VQPRWQLSAIRRTPARRPAGVLAVDSSDRTPSRAPSWTAVAASRLEPIGLAALSLGAAAIHFGVESEHFGEDVRFGLFFAIVGWLEALWAVAFVLRPARWIAALGALGNVATVAVWVWAHIVGLPFGPDAGMVEKTTTTDLMATLFETLLAIWLVAWVALAGRRPAQASVAASSAVIAILIAVIAIGTTIGLS